MLLVPPKTFRISKGGNRPEECEDCFRVVFPYRMRELGQGPDNARIALADGASESAFAKEWAKILTDAFVANPPKHDGPGQWPLAEWLEACQEEWNKVVPWDRIPWHGEAKSREGALATLLGITIGVPPDGHKGLWWRAAAVGDSCLFVIRDDEMAVSFPIEYASDFDNSPPLICSNPVNNGGLWGSSSRLSGNCVSGDLLILASDALSQWMLTRIADGGTPWQDLLDLYSRGQLVEWVDDARRQRLIRNDDTTLIIVQVA